MTDRMCEVANCPAFAERHRHTCGPHRDARTAKDLKIARMPDGTGGKACMNCKRRFAEGDYVFASMQPRAHVRKGRDKFSYAHVSCEPKIFKPSKKTIRESVKPLFDEAVA